MSTTDYHPLIEQFLENQKSKSDGTLGTRKTDLNHFQEWLDRQNYGLTDISPWMLDDYFASLKMDGYAPNTIGTRWGSVRQLFSYMALRDEIDENPMDDDDMKRREYVESNKREHVEAEQITYVTEDEKDMMVANAPAPRLRNRLMIRLMFQTGIRPHEAAGIRYEDDIDRNGHEIEVFDQKNGEKRTVYYHESLDFLLAEWLDGGHRAGFPDAMESDYLFLTRRKPKITAHGINIMMRKAAENAGIQEVLYEDQAGNKRHRVTGHTLRHSHAVYALRCGVDVRTVQKHLGHKSLDMTMRYLRLIEKDVRDSYRNHWGSA